MRIEAVRVAWQVESVKEVINEVRVGEGRDFGDSSQDLWIAKKLESLLIIDAAIKSQNYSIEAVYGTIYLIGIAQDRAELQRVIDHARDVPYVKQVVSHVRLLTETAAAPAS
jgi:osmotically-inducible protein OsmY